MNKFLNNTRSTENEIPVSRKIRNTIIILCLGIVLGTFSKFLDNTASNALPFIFEYLDVRNFLGRFAVWLLIALCIAIYSRSSLRASLNVFVFFVGMVATVYKGNIIKNLIMDCQSYTKYRPNETTGGIFVSWRRKEELPTGA